MAPRLPRIRNVRSLSGGWGGHNLAEGIARFRSANRGEGSDPRLDSCLAHHLCLDRSVRGLATIDGPGGAVDEAGGVTAQVQHGAGDLLRLGHAARYVVLEEYRLELVALHQAWVIGVAMKPGAMQFTRMLARAYSTAAALVRPATACFMAQ